MTDRYQDDPILQQRGLPTEYGDGIHAKPTIEGAARLGYLDAHMQRPFSPHYADADAQWQRNYESGRQWAVAIKAAGLKLPRWPAAGRVPEKLLQALQQVRVQTGSGTRPEDYPKDQRLADDARDMRAFVPILHKRRVVDRLT